MTLAGKIAALLRTLGLRDDLSVSTALDTMDEKMGLESSGSWPECVCVCVCVTHTHTHWPDRADRLMSGDGGGLVGGVVGARIKDQSW